MKRTLLILFLALGIAGAQDTINTTTTATADQANYAAAGLSWNQGASPAIAGTALYARKLTSAGLYSFTVFDVLPTTLQPFTVTNQITTGFAQKIASIKSINIYTPTTAGITWTGNNTGWTWTTGAMATVPVKGYYVMPNIRVIKSSVSNGDGYRLVVGVMFGGKF